MSTEKTISNGWGIIHKKIMKDTRLTIEAKGIYAYLASYAGNDKRAYPSLETITRELRITKNRFYRHLNYLTKYGYINKYQTVKNNKYDKVIYYLIIGDETSDNSYGNDLFPCFEDTHNQEDTINKINKKQDPQEASPPYHVIKELFNIICTTLPKVKDIKGKRQRLVRQCWDEYKDVNLFKEVFEKVDKSDFLSGRNNRWSGCTFDWIMRTSNFQRIIEGAYDNKRDVDVTSKIKEFDFSNL